MLIVKEFVNLNRVMMIFVSIGLIIIERDFERVSWVFFFFNLFLFVIIFGKKEGIVML